jgi:hypothetical protein
MNCEKKYKLLKYVTLAILLLILAIFLIYISLYNVTVLYKTDTNYYTYSFGILTWIGFVGSLVKIVLVYDSI